MTNPSGDPVPAISEADATGEVAALYADIRATLGVPVVNLIWRHLAMFPGALPWAWEALKPLYADDTIAAQAAALRAELQVPALAGLSGPTLAAAGLSPDDLSRITMILRSYERSNAMNMVALCALSARLKGQAPTAGDLALLHLFQPDHAGRSGGGVTGGGCHRRRDAAAVDIGRHGSAGS